MAKRVKQAVGPFRPASTSFENGRERPIEVTLYPEVIEVRTVGVRASCFRLAYSALLRLGAEQEVRHRLKRGAL